MVLAGLGLNPAGVLLFRNHAPQSSLWTKWPLPWSFFPNLCPVLLGFRCFGCIVHSRQLHHLSLGRQKAVRHFFGFLQVGPPLGIGGSTVPEIYPATMSFPFSHPSGVGGMGEMYYFAMCSLFQTLHPIQPKTLSHRQPFNKYCFRNATRKVQPRLKAMPLQIRQQ